MKKLLFLFLTANLMSCVEPALAQYTFVVLGDSYHDKTKFIIDANIAISGQKKRPPFNLLDSTKVKYVIGSYGNKFSCGYSMANGVGGETLICDAYKRIWSEAAKFGKYNSVDVLSYGNGFGSGNYPLGVTGTGTASSLTIGDIFTHENGHVLGLPDTNQFGGIMGNFSDRSNQTFIRQHIDRILAKITAVTGKIIDTIPPQVSILTPINNQVYDSQTYPEGAHVLVWANPKDGVMISELWVNNTITQSQVNWDGNVFSNNTSGIRYYVVLQAGTYNLTVNVYDIVYNKTSSTITIQVN